ncbi:MAG: sialidase family protein [Mycobacteriales bacterium]|nr:glycoside hydrolase [Frankia sp.]
MRLRGALVVAVAAAGVAIAGPAIGAGGRGDSAVHNVSRTPSLAEGEEFIAVNPRNPANVIVGSNQFVPIAGPNSFPVSRRGLVNCAVWSSHDGGRSWRGGTISAPGSVPDEAGIDPQQIHGADQSIVFDRRGTAYFMCQHLSLDPPDFRLLLWRSTDGGRTWQPPTVAFSSSEANLYNHDRPFLVIDQTGGPRDGTLYLSWETMFFQPYLPRVDMRSSRDGGRTWSATSRVDAEGPLRAMWDPRQMPAVGADGSLNIVYAASPYASTFPNDPNAEKITLVHARSTDGGLTFTRTVVDDSVNRVSSPDEGGSDVDELISAIAADPRRRGRIAVAWPDDRSGEARILLRHSEDSGRTWSAPVDVSDDPRGRGNQHDHIALAYLPDGRLLAVWRDRRATGGSWDSPYDVFGRTFAIGRGRRFRAGEVTRITQHSATPTSGKRGVMPSEYLGLAVGRDGVSVSWDELVNGIGDNLFRRMPLSAFR